MLRVHGRVQYPLMQISRPHCDDVVQLFEPGGIGRHAPAIQYSPP